MNALHTARSRWFGFVLIGLCGLLILSSGCGSRRSEQYTEQGETYLLIGNLDAAEKSFTRAFELDSTNARAKMGLARCYWLMKKPKEALAAYQEAQQIDPKLDKAYLEAARISLVTGDVPGAQKIVERYKAVDPIAGGILEGFVLRESGDTDGAIKVLSQLADQHPKNVEVRVSLAAAYRAAKDLGKAENELNFVLDNLDDSSLAARMLLVEVYQAEGKSDEIVSELRDLATQQPENESIQLAYARSLLAVDRFDEAEAIARPILERRPESPWANFVVGSCLLHKKQYTDAIDCLTAAFGGLPNEPAIARMLAIAKQAGTGTGTEETPPEQPEVAEKPAEEEAPTKAWRDLWNDASLRALVDQRTAFLAQDDSPMLPRILLMAALFIQNGDAMRELLPKVPEDSPGRQLVEALMAQDGEKARQVVDNWKPTTEDEKILSGNARGFLYAMGGVRARALQSFTQISADYRDNGVALYNIANMYRGAGMPTFAIAALRQLILRHGQNREARQVLFDVLMQSRRHQEARQLAESTYAMFPQDPMSTIMLARAYREAGDSDLAKDVLQRAIERDPASKILTVALGEILLATGQVDEAEAALDKAASDPQLARQVAVLKAFAAADQKDWQKVLDICTSEAGASYPMSLRLLHLAALINSGDSDHAFEPLLSADGTPITSPVTTVLLAVYGKLSGEASPADAALAEALNPEPANVALFAYALACRDMHFSDRAYELFVELDGRLPAKPRVVAYMLTALANANDLPDREQKATHYTEEYPALPAAWLGLADVEQALGNVDAERSALEKAVEVGPDDVDAWLQYARFLDDQSDNEGMLKAYRKLHQLLPQDPFIANNLAYCILRSNGDVKEALSLAETAYKDAKSSSNVLHTLGLAQLKTGDVDEGFKNLRRALEMRPGDPTLLFDVGKALLAQGKEKEGHDYIQYALHYAEQLGLDFPDKDEAKKLLAGG